MDIGTVIKISEFGIKVYKQYFEKIEIVFSVGNRIKFGLIRLDKENVRASLVLTHYARILTGNTPCIIRTSALTAYPNEELHAGELFFRPYFDWDLDTFHRRIWLETMLNESEFDEETHSFIKKQMLLNEASKRIAAEKVLEEDILIHWTTEYMSEPINWDDRPRPGQLKFSLFMWLSFLSSDGAEELVSKDEVCSFTTGLEPHLEMGLKPGETRAVSKNIDTIQEALFG